ncbi:MAG: hypothetical protein IPP72_01900 [Chitinophagaceae bacterium]|nr:hypothetical protein [Chitinophagaceae bacterium]
MISCIFKTFAATGLLLICNLLPAQNVGIGTLAPNSSAQLEISSTTKGLLIPRVTTLQRTAIAAPANGLMVYDTNLNAFWYYNGSSWAAINSGGGSNWTANGNNIYNSNSGNVGIGTSNPLARLSVDSSIMVDQANSNQGFLDRSSLYFGSDKKVGIVRSFLTGSAGRNGIGFFTSNTRRMTIDSTGQVGIGTINPLQTLHVNGNTYLSGFVGIGSTTPDYAYENLLGYNYMFYGLGVGTVPNSTYMLDVGSALPSRIRGALTVDGAFTVNDNASVDGTLTVDGAFTVNNNAAVDGTLTVNNGKGVAYNANSGTNLRIYSFTTATFGAVLGPHDISAEGAIAFNGGFTGTPKVFVGDIDVTGGTVGQLYMVELQLYGCSTTSGTTTCKARLINNSENSVNYNITWNCVAIGF